MTETSTGLPPRDQPRRSSERRRQLLDAAERVILRDGPNTSMTAIAGEAGITKPILYRHFGDKGGLYRALAERHIEDLLADLRQALGTRGGRRARTEATIDAYLAAIESRPQVYRFLMHRAAAEEAQVRSEVALFLRRLADELALGIRIELGLEERQAARATAWAHGIVGMVQAAGDWWLDQPGIERSTMVRELADLLWGRYASWPDGEGSTR